MIETKVGKTHMSETQAVEKIWYKQFWPWFLIALPSAAVIASFITLDIAIKNADTPVHDDYVQHGLTVLHKNPQHEIKSPQSSNSAGAAQP